MPDKLKINFIKINYAKFFDYLDKKIDHKQN